MHTLQQSSLQQYSLQLLLLGFVKANSNPDLAIQNRQQHPAQNLLMRVLYVQTTRHMPPFALCSMNLERQLAFLWASC